MHILKMCKGEKTTSSFVFFLQALQSSVGSAFSTKPQAYDCHYSDLTCFVIKKCYTAPPAFFHCFILLNINIVIWCYKILKTPP